MTLIEAGPEQFNQDPTIAVMERIHGTEIERNLLDLAQVGGTPISGIPEQPERYAVSRLALTEEDKLARELVIKPLMEQAGMTTWEHPLGLIGTLEGTDPDKPPIIIMSHTDSVPNGDMYDGDLGVIGGIQVVKALQEAGVVNRRTIHVISLTGEESSRFGFALFASKSMFLGLTDQELNAHQPGDQSIREVLGEEASEIVKQPIIGEGRRIPAPGDVIELHVEQDRKLNDSDIALAVVNAIAAPVRHNVQFGRADLEPDTEEPANATYLKLSVRGKSDHSGATPMGPKNRADGLVATSEFLSILADEGFISETGNVEIGSIDIHTQALNKIPGATNTMLRVSGEQYEDVVETIKILETLVEITNASLTLPNHRFGEMAVTIDEIEQAAAGTFYKKSQVLPRQLAALAFIADVNETANKWSSDSVVGTVGTFDISEAGRITLGLDVRGIAKNSRDKAIGEMLFKSLRFTPEGAEFGYKLHGSGDPVELDSRLVQLAKEQIDRYGIGSNTVMFSAAGHDAQNAARAGHPTVMIFTQSNAGGVAHHPDAYTRPENLEQGVRALAALTIRLCA